MRIKARKLELSTKIINSIMGFCAGFYRKAYPEWDVRSWSNFQLKRFGKIYDRDIINVSGWKDSDKHGKLYKDYFPNARSYTTTNYGKEFGKSPYTDEKEFDLSRPLYKKIGRYDLVFTHTVIEHVFEIDTVIDNLCKLSRDSIITIVPFIQCLHWKDGGFKDYWRYTPFSLMELFEKRGFNTVYCTWNNDTPFMNVYIFHIASCKPDKYRNVFPSYEQPEFKKSSPGLALHNTIWPSDKEKTKSYYLGELIGNIFNNRCNY